jgi:hypothetical protein
MSANFVIVADLGHMKAYSREVDPLGRVAYKLLETADNSDALEQNGEKLSDRSGSFRGVGGSGSSGETEKIGLESEKRSVGRLAAWIGDILTRHGGNWHAAIPGKINKRVIDQLDGSAKERLVKNLTSDLTGIAPADLVKHFE